MEYLLDYLLVGDLVSERSQLVCNCGGSLCEVFYAFVSLELKVAKVTAELVHRCLLDPIASHAHYPDRLPGVRGSFLAGEAGLHLLWHRTQ
jgi:hypothetical protein